MTNECWIVAPWSREAVETASLLLGPNHVVPRSFFLVSVSEPDALALLDLLNEDMPTKSVYSLVRSPFWRIPYHDAGLLF